MVIYHQMWKIDVRFRSQCLLNSLGLRIKKQWVATTVLFNAKNP